MDFEAVWTAFSQTINEETAAKYRIMYNDFSQFVNHKPFYKCSDDEAEAYNRHLDELEHSGVIAHSTHRTKISVLRSFGDFIVKCGFYPGYENPFNGILVKCTEPEIKELDMPQLSDLEQLLNASKNNLRDYLIFILIMKCALNTKQICSLSSDDILVTQSGHYALSVLTISSSHNKYNIALPNDVEKVFSQYIETFKPTGSLFLNAKGSPLKKRDLQRLLKKYILALQDQLCKTDFTVSDMRHAGIVYMKAGGANSSDITAYTGLSTPWLIDCRYQKVADDTLNRTADYSILSVHEKY